MTGIADSEGEVNAPEIKHFERLGDFSRERGLKRRRITGEHNINTTAHGNLERKSDRGARKPQMDRRMSLQRGADKGRIDTM